MYQSYMLRCMNTSTFFDSTGKRVRILRQDREWNQLDLVDGLRRHGVSVGSSYISQIENKGKIPSAEILVALAKSLETTTDYLLLLTDDPTRGNTTELAQYYTPEADIVARKVDALPPEARQFCLTFVQQFFDYQQRARNVEQAALMARVEQLVGREQARRLDAALAAEPTGGAGNGNTGDL